MRLDARCGDCGWWVYDCERCEVLKSVVWVDDQINEYGRYREVTVLAPHIELTIETVRVRKVLILSPRKIVLINPIEDLENLEPQLTKEAA